MNPTPISPISTALRTLITLAAIPASLGAAEFLDADGFPVEVDDRCVAQAVQVELLAITVDGDLSDWGDIPTYDFPVPAWQSGGDWGDPITVGVPASDNISGLWRAAWDSQYLYLSFDITDDVSQTGDGIDIYLDGDFSHYVGTAWNQPGYDFVNDWQKQIYRDGTVEAGLYDASTLLNDDLDLDVVVMETDHGYNIEVAIRITSINSSLFSAEVGSYLGLDLNITDFDEDIENRTGVIGWCAQSADTYGNPALFGVLVLGDMDGGSSGGNPWESLSTTGGFKNTADASAPGVGWIYDGNYPWIYSYGFGSGEWFYYLESASEGPNALYGYNANGGYYFWANSSWGFYYDFSSGEWNRFNGTE